MPTILIADDDPDIGEVLTAVFTAVGMEVLAASDGLTALRLAEQHPPDAVLADMDMPGLDGFELCRAMRAHDHLKAVPMAILTGRLLPGDPRIRDIACAVMLEPRSNKELVATMRDLIDQGRHDHETGGACLHDQSDSP